MTSTDTEIHHGYVGVSLPMHVRIIFIVIGSIYIVIGVSGNIFMIFTIAITKSMRNPHYYFIMNLALSDLLITGYVLPHVVMAYILGYYPVINFNHCIFNGFVTVTVYVSSLLSLMAISINRYLSVCHNNLFSKIFSNKIVSSLVGCSTIWFLAVMSTAPCLLNWGRFVFDVKTHYCGYDRTYSFSYTLFLLATSIGIPVVIVFSCNFAIWRFVRRAQHRIYAFTKRQQREQEMGQQQQQQHQQQQLHQQHQQQQDMSQYQQRQQFDDARKNHASSSINYDKNESNKNTFREETLANDQKNKIRLEIIEVEQNATNSEHSQEASTAEMIVIKYDNNSVDITSTHETSVCHDGSDQERSQLRDEAEIATQNNSSSANQNSGHMDHLKPGDGRSDMIGLEIGDVKREVNAHAHTIRNYDGDEDDIIVKAQTIDVSEDKRRDARQRTNKKKSSTLVKKHQHTSSSVNVVRNEQTRKGPRVLVTPGELALIKTVFVIFITFATFMTPYMISTLMDVNNEWPAVAHITCSFTSFTNSCLNCVLYGIMTPAFKKAYKRLMPCYRNSKMNSSEGGGRRGGRGGVGGGRVDDGRGGGKGRKRVPRGTSRIADNEMKEKESPARRNFKNFEGGNSTQSTA